MDYFTKIPLELVGEILAQCSRDDPDSPAVLLSVCRTFYRAAHISPQAWTNLRLTTGPTAARKTERWLSRSGDCVMKVSVEVDASDGASEYQNKLAKHLQQHGNRIVFLALRADTEKQVHSLLSSMYASPVSRHVGSLRLALNIISEPTTAGHQPLFPPHMPSLSSLRLITPALPNLSNANFSSLRNLIITRPIRAQPLPMKTVQYLFESSPGLVRFELETRLDLAPDHPIFPPPTQTSLSASPDVHALLFTLAALTNLSLRTNNNPALLSMLVVPSLKLLHLNALDGKRRGRAEETAIALQRLLLRMDTFVWDKLSPITRKVGIETLEFAGVSIYRAPHGRNELWEWCFRRMRMLCQISARNMDTEHLVELLTQGMGRESIPGYLGLDREGDAVGEAERDNAVCPRLECLAIPAPDASNAMRWFKLARPFVKVRALGYDGYPQDSRWNNEDALKPVKVAYFAEQRPNFGAVEKNFDVASKVGAHDGTAVKEISCQLRRTGDVELRVASEATKDAEEKSAKQVTPPPRAIVGGFGFGSPFGRMRTQASAESPLRDDRPRRLVRHDELF